MMLEQAYLILKSKGCFHYFPVLYNSLNALRFVEEQYRLDMGNAQLSQLSRALATGSEKGTFVFPKGWSILGKSEMSLIKVV